jgi:hypothetical protein
MTKDSELNGSKYSLNLVTKHYAHIKEFTVVIILSGLRLMCWGNVGASSGRNISEATYFSTTCRSVTLQC